MDSNQKCETPGCGRDAACYGAYEGVTEKTYACDGCCGHGNEDGHCEPVAAICERDTQAEIASLREQVRTLTDALEAERRGASLILAEHNARLEQVRTLTAERDEARKYAHEADTSAARAANRAEVVGSERDALRARVAELEAYVAKLGLDISGYKGTICEQVEIIHAVQAERDAAQQRAKAADESEGYWQRRYDAAERVGWRMQEALVALSENPGVRDEARRRLSTLAVEWDTETNPAAGKTKEAP